MQFQTDQCALSFEVDATDLVVLQIDQDGKVEDASSRVSVSEVVLCPMLLGKNTLRLKTT